MQNFTIGQLARTAGVGVETVRFYQRKGLLDTPSRAAGVRRYSQTTLERLRFIRQSQKVGFTLKEIRELLALRDDPATRRSDIQARTDAKIADIDTRIQDLLTMRAALVAFRTSCQGDGPILHCPILESLQSGAEIDGELPCNGHPSEHAPPLSAAAHHAPPRQAPQDGGRG